MLTMGHKTPNELASRNSFKRQFLENGVFTDVVLDCNDGSILAHSIILASGSEYFRTILTKASHETPVNMRNYAKGTVEVLVKFIYGYAIPEDVKTNENLLKNVVSLSYVIGPSPLFKISWYYLLKIISVSNIGEYLRLAEQYVQNKSETQIYYFVLENIETKCYLQMPQDKFKAFLEFSFGHVRQEELVVMVDEWIVRNEPGSNISRELLTLCKRLLEIDSEVLPKLELSLYDEDSDPYYPSYVLHEVYEYQRYRLGAKKLECCHRGSTIVNNIAMCPDLIVIHTRSHGQYLCGTVRNNEENFVGVCEFGRKMEFLTFKCESYGHQFACVGNVIFAGMGKYLVAFDCEHQFWRNIDRPLDLDVLSVVACRGKLFVVFGNLIRMSWWFTDDESDKTIVYRYKPISGEWEFQFERNERLNCCYCKCAIVNCCSEKLYFINESNRELVWFDIRSRMLNRRTVEELRDKKAVCVSCDHSAIIFRDNPRQFYRSLCTYYIVGDRWEYCKCTGSEKFFIL